MAMLNFDVSHQLSKEEALLRAKKLLEHWCTKYGIRTRWEEDTAHLDGKVMGITLQGHMTITSDGVHGEASDPGMLFRARARKYLEEKFAEALDPNRKLEDLMPKS